MNTSILKTLSRPGLSLLVTALLAACGGGGGGTESTTSGAFDVAGGNASGVEPTAQVTTAPTPDSASVNGDIPLSAQKVQPLVDASSPTDTTTQSSAVAEAETMSTALAASVATASDGTAATQTQFIYVSPTGNDAWTGLISSPNAAGTDGPVKTLPVAQSIARAKLAAMSTGIARAAIKVRISAGQYYLSAPLAFTPADSGTTAAPVYYEAVTPGSVLISGGAPLNRAATSNAANQVKFNAPATAGSAWKGGSQLYVNGRRATLARQPNDGQYWFVKDALPLSTEPKGDVGREAFTTSTDALTWLGGLSAADRSRAVINVMESWSGGHHRFSEQPAPSGAVRLLPRASRPFLMFGLSQRLFIENVSMALDAPREWIWDNSGISYIPGADESISSVTGVMPVLEKLVTIQGDIAKRQWVQNVWFTGLSFAHTRYLVPDGGFSDVQAAVDIGAAIEVDGAVGVVIDNCNISHTGGYGIWFRREVRDSRVTNSTLTDLGAGGLKFGQASQSLADPIKTGANSAVGNRISETGKIFPGSVGIWVGQSFDNVVANNAIFNTTYTGISVGWTWGYGAATSGRNKIINNLLTNIGQGQLSDLGAIYTVGISPGTVISGNVIREVRAYPGYGPGAWGIYNDQGASELLVENNVIVGTDSGGYHLNFGRNNIVRQNLFARGAKADFRVTTTDPLKTNLEFQENILIPSVRQPFDAYAESPDVIFAGNKVSNSSANTTLDLSKCGTGCSAVPAVLAAGTEPRDVSLSSIDAATITRVAQTAAKAGPADLATGTPVPVASAPPVVAVAAPTPLTLDIGNAAMGTQPKGLQYVPLGDTSAISVIRDASAPGGRCLAFNDNGLYKYAYYPYVYTSLNHDRGTSTAEFALLIDAKTNFLYEWRDGGNPYKTGPALQITTAGVVVKGKVVAPAPSGQWLTFRVTSPVDNPSGTWNLEVTNAGGAKTAVANLQFASSGWTKLIWMGFTSNATTTSTACLGAVRITSSIQ